MKKLTDWIDEKLLTFQESLTKSYFWRLKVRSLRHLLQKKTKGWSDDETWSLYSETAKYLLPRLVRFRELTVAFPVGKSEEWWHEKLDLMIFAMRHIVWDDLQYEETEEAKEMEKQLLSYRSDRENWYELRHKGTRTLGKYFHYLWW